MDNFTPENIIVPKGPSREAICYDLLWRRFGVNLSRMTAFLEGRHLTPSGAVDAEAEEKFTETYAALLELTRLYGFQLLAWGYPGYPAGAYETANVFPMLYCRGNTTLLKSGRRVAVIGARKASPSGLARARRLAGELACNGVTVVSGLAAGVDTQAHSGALGQRGSTIAVIGTPLNHTYPAENRTLQEMIAMEHLLISHVPPAYYNDMEFNLRRQWFPQRNELMSAISDATVIVEASDRSGSLIQARACLQQKHPLFILASCFQVPGLRWPEKYEALGAIRVKTIEDILERL